MGDWRNDRGPPQYYVFEGTIVNGPGGAGNHTYIVTPGEGNLLEFIEGSIFNGDTVDRTLSSRVDTGTSGEVIGGGFVQSTVLPAADHTGLYSTLTGLATSPQALGRPVLGGTARLVITISSVALSQDTAFGFQAWLWGTEPTMTLAGASTPVLTTNEARVFA